MNRLVLVGNGFDLAHGMKTTYHDFILDYLREGFRQMFTGTDFKDQICHIFYDKSGWKLQMTGSDVDSWTLKNFTSHLKQKSNVVTNLFGAPELSERNRYSLESTSPLFAILLQNCSEYNWVDIENEYYSLLCKYAEKNQQEEIRKLNSDLQFITNLLIDYLKKIERKFIEKDEGRFRLAPLVDQITQKIVEYSNISDPIFEHVVGAKPQKIVFVNFNYTETLHDYLPKIKQKIPSVDVINIHGDLENRDNPVIFGYGDEEETNFKLLEKYDECLKFVKTYWYSRTQNYQNLLNFINAGEYEVFVLGHSCGMSDKTLLSEIFNNDNCKHIRLLHYVKDLSKDANIENTDYISKQYQVGRLFTDKGSLRKKLIPFNHSDSIKIYRLNN